MSASHSTELPLSWSTQGDVLGHGTMSRVLLPAASGCPSLRAALSCLLCWLSAFCFYFLKLFPPHFSACSWNAPRVLVLLKLSGARAAPGRSCGPPASLSCFLERETKRYGILPGCVLFSLKLHSPQAVSQGWEAHCSWSHHQHTSAS